MKVTYNWYILGASGKLITPQPYTNEWEETLELRQGYNDEYEALKNMHQYMEYNCPAAEEQFTLVKTYEYR